MYNCFVSIEEAQASRLSIVFSANSMNYMPYSTAQPSKYQCANSAVST